MSHSRLFQVDTKPIEKDDYISDDTFYSDYNGSSNFVGTIADYISEVVNFDNNDIDWLKTAYEVKGGVEVNVEERTIKIIDKEVFFAKKYEKLKEIMSKPTLTLSQFAMTATVGDGDVRDYSFFDFYYDIERVLHGDRFGMYLYSDTDGYDTVDEFIRYCHNGDTLYIGAVFDYHS